MISFEWWIVLIVTLVGTAIWAGSIYYYASITTKKEKK